MKTMRKTTFILVAIGALGLATPALAANDGTGRTAQPVAFFKDMALAAIQVVKEAAQATSDTVHHNVGNVMGTAAKARGFVRDSVGGMLGNARKLTGMVGDMMPLTTHNHYEGVAPERKGRQVEN